MYCKWCGNKIDSFTECCTKCGRAAYLQPPPNIQKPGKSHGTKALIFGIAAVISCALNIGMDIFFQIYNLLYPIVVFCGIMAIGEYQKEKNKIYMLRAKSGKFLAVTGFLLDSIWFLVVLEQRLSDIL